MPRVSILMPTYNRGPTLLGAVNSCINQTFGDWQLLIYDDGSNSEDGYAWIKGKLNRIGPTTEEALRGVKDKRVKYVKCKDNKGIPAARNALLKMVDTELACWLDSDDRSNKWRLQLQVETMDKYAPPYVRTATTTFGGDKDVGINLPPILVWRGGVSFATIMFQKKLAPGFDERINCCGEDMEWECHLAAIAGRGYNVPLTLYAIGRRTPARMSMCYKSDEYVTKYKNSMSIKDKMQERWIKVMQDKGYTKLPVNVPWEFVARHMEKWYGKKYG